MTSPRLHNAAVFASGLMTIFMTVLGVIGLAAFANTMPRFIGWLVLLAAAVWLMAGAYVLTWLMYRVRNE